MRLVREELLQKLVRGPLDTAEVLYLDRQGIERVGDGFQTCVQVKDLRMRHNRVAKLPENCFLNCRNLWRLDLVRSPSPRFAR